MTFGFDADLNVAMEDALEAMVRWLQVLTGLAKAAALALASTCVQPTWEVRPAQKGARSWRLRILPEPVRGSSPMKSTERGTL